ncbi:uncharacterized protein RCC_08813 [Ramularia collo-cygni]|uniref:Uncharacterized protein n=1 Tax=Ramularia collo-cygni TaxID=112498 RepID=A0A2D3V537_9PEZI|nr:uncharacterized protein RCC_08813 [Ramularia collo-cygni]CZT23103.1 uncharacterized protein RCC_08813 [Ramularia collo-cygni]
MEDLETLIAQSRFTASLYLAVAFALYTDKMKSKAEAHDAHIIALNACNVFENGGDLVQAGVLKPMGQWAKSLLEQPDSLEEWTVPFHDLIGLAERELAAYDEVMEKEKSGEEDPDWRVQQGANITFLQGLGVVAGEKKVGRWEERKQRLRRAVGSVKLKTKRSLSRLRDTLRGKVDG